jgi:hypothetical protein
MTEYEVGDVVNGHRFNGIKWLPLPPGTVTVPPPPPPMPSQAEATVTRPSPDSERPAVQTQDPLPATPASQPSIAPPSRDFVWDGTTWVVASTNTSTTPPPRDFIWDGTTWATAPQRKGHPAKDSGTAASLQRWTAILSPLGTVLLLLGVFVGRPIGPVLFGIGLLTILTSVALWSIGRARRRKSSLP